MPEALARLIAGAAHAPNQLTIYYTEAGRADASATDAALAAMARGHGAVEVVTRAAQPNNSALSQVIRGFAELAVLFPLLYLTAAGMATFVVLTRRVARDRAIIGMLRANGYRRRTVLGHYLATGLLVGRPARSWACWACWLCL